MIRFRQKSFATLSQAGQLRAQISQNALQRTNIVRQGNIQTQQMIQQRQNMNMQKMMQKNSMDKAKLSVSKAKADMSLKKERLKAITSARNVSNKLAVEKAKNVSLFKRPASIVKPVPIK